MKVIQFITC